MKLLPLYLAIFAVANNVQGAPLQDNLPDTPLATIQKRNPCDGVNALPNLYHDYYEDSCPAKYHVQSDQTCEKRSWYNGDTECGTFCQNTTHFTRAQESPFPRSECHWPGRCTLTEGHSTSWNWGVGFSPKIGKALKVGISGSYGESYGTSNGISWSFEPDPHQCGYFTFVPTKKTTCGTLTTSNPMYVDGGYWCTYEQFQNNRNFCADQVWTINGEPDGTVIFVKIDCATRQPLPMEDQDEVYRLPGVPLDRGTYDTMMSTWVDNSCGYWHVTTTLREQNAFEIHGKNFADGPLGANGEQLKQKIEACGLPQGSIWAFDMTPDDPNWDWKASGCIPFTAKPGCVGDAIMAVGGRTKDACT